MTHGLLVAVFGGVRPARAARQRLQRLHAAGHLTLFGVAILMRTRSGDVVPVQARDSVGDMAAAPAVAAAIGALPLLLGRSLTAAASTNGTALIPALHDLEAASLDAWFLARVASVFRLGAAALVAEVTEDAPRADPCLRASCVDVLWRPLGPTLQEQRLAGLTTLAAQFFQARRRAQQDAGAALLPLQQSPFGADLPAAATAARTLARALRCEGEAKVAVLRLQASAVCGGERSGLARRAEQMRRALHTRSMELDHAAECAEAVVRRLGVAGCRAPSATQ